MSFLKDGYVSDFTFVATKVWFTETTINISLTDGRIISNPLTLYPFLTNASKEQLENFRLFGGGTAIHFKDIDEDISVTDIVLGTPYFDANVLPTKKRA